MNFQQNLADWQQHGGLLFGAARKVELELLQSWAHGGLFRIKNSFRINRGNKYSVIYSYTDAQGNSRQKWKTCKTLKQAQARKVTIEAEMLKGTFIEPRKQTVEEFMWDFVKLYGEKKWGVSMYNSSCALIVNYIIPIIGQKQMQEMTARTVDELIQTLRHTPSATAKTHKATSKFLTDSNIEKIYKLLRCAFKQAVRWEIIGKNPFDNAILPRTHYKAGQSGTRISSGRLWMPARKANCTSP